MFWSLSASVSRLASIAVSYEQGAIGTDGTVGPAGSTNDSRSRFVESASVLLDRITDDDDAQPPQANAHNSIPARIASFQYMAQLMALKFLEAINEPVGRL